MQFRIKMTNELAILFERSPHGNVNIALTDKDGQQIATTVEKGSDFVKMASLLSD